MKKLDIVQPLSLIGYAVEIKYKKPGGDYFKHEFPTAKGKTGMAAVLLYGGDNSLVLSGGEVRFDPARGIVDAESAQDNPYFKKNHGPKCKRPELITTNPEKYGPRLNQRAQVITRTGAVKTIIIRKFLPLDNIEGPTLAGKWTTGKLIRGRKFPIPQKRKVS